MSPNLSSNVSKAGIILASSSPYRKELLSRLGLVFTTQSPNVDESRQLNETPAAMALRLAANKASAIAAHQPQNIVIGSDQVCAYGNDIINKPGSHANAVQQLQRFSGQSIALHSAVTVQIGRQKQSALVSAKVVFKTLSAQNIESYLHKEQPYDCAGACKIEGLGITLIQSIDCNDPTALMGMPMIELTTMLINVGIVLP